MNNYIFIRVVGKGSYGEVHLVKHKTDRKQYVIKKLNLTTSSKRERRAAEQEAQLLSQLRHPNIVTYRESWEGDDFQLYIVMGFCEGGDLYHRLKQQKGELLPERQVVEWFVQIAMALQYLHEKHILHRDLKTQNIFLTKTNIIKVGDLGIARILENQNDMASTLIGTPYYMSPELFSNKPYNHKSDVWALGCCVYEMSTLKHAFNAKDMNSLVYRIVEGKLPQMPSKYDAQLGELIKSMLCKRPEDRPDVKLILRQPYIKRQIAMFLEATKEKTAKSRKKAVGVSSSSRANSAASGLSPQPNADRPLQPPHSDPHPRIRENEESQSQQQPCKISNGVSEKHPARSPPSFKSPSPDNLHSTSVSMATISNIDIDLQRGDNEEGLEERAARREGQPQRAESNSRGGQPQRAESNSRGGQPQRAESNSRGGQPQRAESNSRGADKPAVSDVKGRGREEKKLPNGPSHAATNSAEKRTASVDADDKDDTMELLRDVVTVPELGEVAEAGRNLPELSYADEHKDTKYTGESKVAAPRPLPPTPAEALVVEGRSRSKGSADRRKATSAASFTSLRSSQDGRSPLLQDRPLSARERRRLRQSQDNPSQPAVNAVRRASYDVAPSNTKPNHHHRPVTRSMSESTSETNEEEQLSGKRSEEEDCSSSTSSTDHSEWDCREGKNESSDMQDLVQMMSQTLRLDGQDAVFEPDGGRLNSTVLPEFKLNRKYRDTLVLHGKAREEQEEDFHFGELPAGGSSGPAKIRRAIEHLRTDTVKGLGVKLLDRVLDIMEEEDEDMRETRLREEMGEEKYLSYAVKVRQLKFFEDVAFKS
ncbi:serine/threonine-protein kinase Nek4 [Aplochiton taeniatus]